MDLQLIRGTIMGFDAEVRNFVVLLRDRSATGAQTLAQYELAKVFAEPWFLREHATQLARAAQALMDPSDDTSMAVARATAEVLVNRAGIAVCNAIDGFDASIDQFLV